MIKKNFFLFCTVFAISSVFLTCKLSANALPGHGANTRVSNLLIMAMKSRDSGNMKQAYLFWQQAKALRPSIAKPKWLTSPPVRQINSNLTEKEQYAVIASLPYKLAKPILEGMIQAKPGNKKLRSLYAAKANEAHDTQQIKRNSSFIATKKIKKSKAKTFKIILILALLILIFWQVFKIYKEIQNKPHS